MAITLQQYREQIKTYKPSQQAPVKSAPISPRGKASKFKAPTGGTQIGPNKWKTPSGSTWEYKPDGTRIVRLAAQFGGGSYLVNPDKPGEVVREPEKAYGGIPEKAGQQRDHIVPHALGGTSDSRTNIRPVPSAQNEGEFENKIIDQYQSGQKPLGQARLEIMTRKQEQHGNVPKQGVKENLLPAFQEQLQGTGDIVQQIKQDPLNIKKATPNPVTATKQVVSAMWNAVKEPVIQEGERLKNYFDTLNTKGNTAARVGAGTQALTGVANIAFSPITALFEGANQMPVLGTVSRAITIPFSMVGEAGANLAKPVIDQLPISQEAKDQITPGVQEIFALAGQLLLGKAGLESRAWEKLKTKYGERDATTIVNEARKMAFKEQQKQAVAQEKKLVEQAAREVKPAPVADPLIQEARKYKSAEKFVRKESPALDYLEQIKKDENYLITKAVTGGDESRGLARIFQQRIDDGKVPKNVLDDFYSKTGAAIDMEAGVPISPLDGVRASHIDNFLDNPKVSQLTDIWNKAQVSIPKPKTIENKEFKSRVFERLQAERPELKGDLKVERVNMEKDLDRGIQLMEKDKQTAYEIAIGRQTSPDVTSTAVNIVMAEKALSEGNTKLYSELVTKRSLEQTRRGQEIVAEKGSIKDNSTSRYVKELINSRMEALGKNFLDNLSLKRKSTKERVMKKIDDEVTNLEKKVKSKDLDTRTALALLEKLTCV